MAKKERRPRYKTPKGEFIYPHLNEPDTVEFEDGTQSKPAFKVRLKLEGAAAEGLKAFIDEQVEASFSATVAALSGDSDPRKKAKAKKVVKAYPYEAELDAAGNQTGALLFNFKQNAQIRLKDGTIKDVIIPVFGADGRPLDLRAVRIGSGSVGYIAYSMRPYFVNAADKAGVTLDLIAAQVTKLVQHGEKPAAAFGFVAEDGEGFAAEDGEGSASVEPAGAALGNDAPDNDNDADF